MKLIDVSTPKYPNIFAMVDDEDFYWLNQWTWHPHKKGRNIYAKNSKARMHRLIMGAEPGQMVDHADGNSLNNQRYNLRFCTNGQNMTNIDKPKHGKTSKYKGVHWVRKDKLFFASVKINRKRIPLGYFRDERDAALAYNAGAIKHFGEFARINRLGTLPGGAAPSGGEETPGAPQDTAGGRDG